MMTNTNTIEIATDNRRASVPVTMYIRAFRRTQRSVAGKAAVAMLHAWNTASACHAFNNLNAAAVETLTYAGTTITGAL